MAFTNFDTKEIHCKILYFGPEQAGKTENLRALFATTSQGVQTGLLELQDPQKLSPYFDFLPLSLGYIKDFHLKMHLFSLSLSQLFDTVLSVLLKGIDGFIFVADSQIERLQANMETLGQVKKLLAAEGYEMASLPRVFQYNKRDLHELVPIDILRETLNPGGAAEHEAIAKQAIGTMESLQSMAKQVLARLAPSS